MIYRGLLHTGLALLGLLSARPQHDLRLDDPAAEAARHEDAVAALLTRHLAARDEYRRAFANLIADETRVIEIYNDKGKPQTRRSIESDLLVYTSSRNGETNTTEFRDVRAVNGKVVKKRRERAIELLTRASDARSIEGELATIDEETSRYEFNRHVRGFTINQGSPDDLREGFHVEIAGRDQFAGRDVIVLAYRQTAWASRPRNRLLPPLPPEFGNARLISQGRLWIDAATSQLWRSVWELAAPHPSMPVPLVMVHTDSTYAPSRFDILTPERIVIEWRDTFRHPKNGAPEFLVKQRDTFSYGAFRQFETAARLIP